MATDQIQDGGPAFPLDELNGDGALYRQHLGLSLRDYFAAQALNGISANSKFNPTYHISECAKFAYEVADEMLKVRAVPPSPWGRK